MAGGRMGRPGYYTKNEFSIKTNTIAKYETKMNVRIMLISLLAMSCVVCWHCYCGSRIERYVIPCCMTWAVPWFFFVSGVMLAKSLKRKGVVKTMQGKVMSLFAPYVFWCLIGALVTGWSLCGGWSGIFALRSISPTGNTALWYLRALMFFVLLWLIISAIIRRDDGIGRVFRIAVFLAVVVVVNRFCYPLGTGSSPFYFAAGVLLSEHVLLAVTKCHVFVAVCSGIISVVAKGVYFILGYNFMVAGGALWANLSYITLMILLWEVSALFVAWAERNSWVAKAGSLTAFVYFMHYPFIRKIIAALSSTCEGNAMGLDALYAVCVLVLPLMFLSFAAVGRKFLPCVYGILSGGR